MITGNVCLMLQFAQATDLVETNKVFRGGKVMVLAGRRACVCVRVRAGF